MDYLQVLVTARSPTFLISAYDISAASSSEKARIQELLGRAFEAGAVGLMDSGNYESYWHRNSNWTTDTLATILPQTQIPLAFCFDQQNPPTTADAIAAEVVSAVLRDQALAAHTTVLPIVHAPTALLPTVVFNVVRHLHPLMIAVPERELGEGMLARAETLTRIRLALESLGHYTPLHLLGTGNPHSILLYALCGADSFDGLEWCQTVADPTTAHLHHFQQREMLDDSAVARFTSGMNYSLGTLVHNLSFFQEWMKRVRNAVHSGSGARELEVSFSAEFLKKLRHRMPQLRA